MTGQAPSQRVSPNWFNQELFGRPTTVAWGLEMAPVHRPARYAELATFHPTFLYELLWDLAVVVVLVVLDRRLRLGHGKVFALYVALYSAGRFWVEASRIDTVNRIGAFRLNSSIPLIGFVAALVVLAWLVRHRPGREEVVEVAASTPAPSAASATVRPVVTRPASVQGDRAADVEPGGGALGGAA